MKPEDHRYNLPTSLIGRIAKNRAKDAAGIIDRHLDYLGARAAFDAATGPDACAEDDATTIALLGAHLRDNSIARGNEVAEHIHQVHTPEAANTVVIDERLGDMLGYMRLSAVDLFLLAVMVGDDFTIDGDIGGITVMRRREEHDELRVALPIGGGIRLCHDRVFGLPAIPETVTLQSVGRKLSDFVSHPLLDMHPIVIQSWDDGMIWFGSGARRPLLPVSRKFGQGEKSGM